MEIKPEVLKQSISALVKLQEIDAQVFKLNAEIKHPPSPMVELQKKMEEADKNFRVADRVFREADRERRALELKLLTLTQDIKKAEGKKTEVRNTKEEFAAGKEVDLYRKRLQEIKTAFDEKTGLAQQKSTVREEKLKVLTDFQAEYKKLQTERESSLSGLQDQMVVLQKQRDEYIAKVDELVFSLYERVQKIRKGSGIALVDSEICGGCFVTISPHDRLKLSKMASIVTCSSCSRILYPADQLEPGTSIPQAQTA